MDTNLRCESCMTFGAGPIDYFHSNTMEADGALHRHSRGSLHPVASAGFRSVWKKTSVKNCSNVILPIASLPLSPHFMSQTPREFDTCWFNPFLKKSSPHLIAVNSMFTTFSSNKCVLFRTYCSSIPSRQAEKSWALFNDIPEKKIENNHC